MTSAVNKQDSSFAPGLTVKVRDELWLITSVAQFVDPSQATVLPDDSRAAEHIAGQ